MVGKQQTAGAAKRAPQKRKNFRHTRGRVWVQKMWLCGQPLAWENEKNTGNPQGQQETPAKTTEKTKKKAKTQENTTETTEKKQEQPQEPHTPKPENPKTKKSLAEISYQGKALPATRKLVVGTEIAANSKHC